MADLFGEPLTGPSGAGATPRCTHPRQFRERREVRDLEFTVRLERCTRCGVTLDPAKQSAGRRANRRGRRIQKKSMEAAGMDNLPGNLPGLDGSRGMFRGESKSGLRFPEQMWRWLQAIPAAPGQVRVLVVSDAPGPGYKRRSITMVESSDWTALHGEDGLDE